MGHLAERFGERFTTAQATRDHHSNGESYHTPRLPDAVVYPESTAEVSEVLRSCSEARVPVVPFGAGSSIEGNVIPMFGGVCIDLTLMNRILRVSADDLDCTVEAGVTRNQLNTYLRDTGLAFFIDPGADATLGGMAATRASGTTAVRYGTMRENVLGLTVVLADGRILKTGGRARKSSAGYDLTRLFVGSEGTLGIITDVTLRLHGVPDSISAAVAAFDSIDNATAAVIQIIQLGIPVARIELLDEHSMDAVNRFSHLNYRVTPTLFLEFHGPSERNVVEQAEMTQAIMADHGGGDFQWATGTEERQKLWEARHQAYYASLALHPGARGWVTDVCVPISRLAECIAESRADLAGSFLQGGLIGHVGDGNFHMSYMIHPERPEELAEAKRLNDRLVGHALRMGGTCTGEHGVGMGKMDSLVLEHGEVAIDVMRDIKRTLDPHGILNPGKVIRP